MPAAPSHVTDLLSLSMTPVSPSGSPQAVVGAAAITGEALWFLHLCSASLLLSLLGHRQPHVTPYLTLHARDTRCSLADRQFYLSSSQRGRQTDSLPLTCCMARDIGILHFACAFCAQTADVGATRGAARTRRGHVFTMTL